MSNILNKITDWLDNEISFYNNEFKKSGNHTDLLHCGRQDSVKCLLNLTNKWKASDKYDTELKVLEKIGRWLHHEIEFNHNVATYHEEQYEKFNDTDVYYMGRKDNAKCLTVLINKWEIGDE